MGTPNAKRIAFFAPKEAILMAGVALIVDGGIRVQ